MSTLDLIVISQSEIVNYDKLSEFPLEKIDEFKELVYPRMVHYKGRFRSHCDILNKQRYGTFMNEVSGDARQNHLSIWNLPGFVGIHLASYLQKYGFSAQIINNFDLEWERFENYYENSDQPPLIAISTTFHLTFAEIKKITRKIKSSYPDASIILGGAFVNGLVDTGQSEGLERSMKKHGIDYAVHSVNSEFDLLALLQWRANGSNPDELTKVNNLFYLKEKGRNGVVGRTESKWNSPLLEATPADLSRIDLPFVNRTVQMRASAGCSFSCAFCSYPEIAKGFHAMPIEAVEEQIRTYLSLGRVDKIIFFDDTPNLPAKRWIELCKMFAKYDFEWFSFLRVQYVDDEIARLMKDSGCVGVYLGVESANDVVLKNMNKRATRQKFMEGIEHLNRYGITSMAAFVLGFPGETKDTLKDNIQFIKDAGIDFYSLKEFYYMENTPVHLEKDKFGLEGMGNKWAHDTMHSEEIYEHKIESFLNIKDSVFIDPDTSLWYLAYLYDQGYSMSEVASLQANINDIMADQIQGRMSDDHQGFARIENILKGSSVLV